MGQGKEGTLSINHATPNQEFFLTKQYWDQATSNSSENLIVQVIVARLISSKTHATGSMSDGTDFGDRKHHGTPDRWPNEVCRDQTTHPPSKSAHWVLNPM